MIYFDPETKRRVVNRLLDRLLPTGYLFLGHAESLAGLSDRARSAGPTKNTAEDDTEAPGAKAEPMVTRVAYEQLHEKLTNTEELLQDVLAEAGED